jgi:Protein of unknown function (DUF2569)
MTQRPGPVGIGGWLTLIALGQILGPLKLLTSTSTYFSSLPSEMWIKFPLVVYFEAALNISVLAISAATTFLFFSKSRLFPTFFIMEAVAAILSYPFDVIISAVGLSAYSGQPASIFVEKMLEPKDIAQLLATAVTCAIWILYIKSSKRVANTFFPREGTDGPAAPYGQWSDGDNETFKRLLAARRA